jgi:excisionase family DNA binding protein
MDPDDLLRRQSEPLLSRLTPTPSLFGTSDAPWLTVRQAASRTQRGKQTILNALACEELRGYRRGDRGRWRIHYQDLDAWVRGEKADVQIRTITRRPNGNVTSGS